jgi:hypothetical protein
VIRNKFIDRLAGARQKKMPAVCYHDAGSSRTEYAVRISKRIATQENF